MESGFAIGLEGKTLESTAWAGSGTVAGRFGIRKKEGKPDETCRCDPGDGSLLAENAMQFVLDPHKEEFL